MAFKPNYNFERNQRAKAKAAKKAAKQAERAARRAAKKTTTDPVDQDVAVEGTPELGPLPTLSGQSSDDQA
jgi:hypothetical protein